MSEEEERARPGHCPKGTEGRYAARPNEMLCSWAWHVLPDVSRKALERIEVEHTSQRGVRNGRLLVTYDQFEEWGVRRASIKFGLEALELFGFVGTTRRGRNSTPSTYRLTYVIAVGQNAPKPSHEWKRWRDKASARKALIELEAKHKRKPGTRKAAPTGKEDTELGVGRR